MSTNWGYARCSTNESRQDVNRQVRELVALGADQAHIFTEYASGAKADRAELKKLLDAAHAGDTIYATELSRITRSLRQLIDIMDWAKGRQVRLVLGGLSVDYRNKKPDIFTEHVAQIIGVIAELERAITVERVRSGLDNARAKGVQLGRRHTTAADVPQAFRRNYERYRRGEVNFIDCCRMAQVGKTAGYKYRKLLDEERRG